MLLKINDINNNLKLNCMYIYIYILDQTNDYAVIYCMFSQF